MYATVFASAILDYDSREWLTFRRLGEVGSFNLDTQHATAEVGEDHIGIKRTVAFRKEEKRVKHLQIYFHEPIVVFERVVAHTLANPRSISSNVAIRSASESHWWFFSLV